MIAWYRMQFRARLSDRLIGDLMPEVTSEFVRCGLNLVVLDVTTQDLSVPVFIACVAKHNRGKEGLAFGMSAGTTCASAAQKAVMEAIHTWIWCELMSSNVDALLNPVLGSHFGSFDSRVLAYGAGFMSQQVDRFRSAVEVTPVEDAVESEVLFRSSRALSEHLFSLGHSVSLVDVTSVDVASLGMSVVRAVIPTMQAMDADHSTGLFNSKRLNKWGITDRPIDPHPFP